MIDAKYQEKRREKRRKLYEKASARQAYTYNTSAKPPKKAPARARMPKVCPNSNAAVLPALEESAALALSELLELSSAELLSLVEDAPPKPE